MGKIVPSKPIKALEAGFMFTALGLEATIGTVLYIGEYPFLYALSKAGPADLRRLMEKYGSLRLKPHYDRLREFYNHGVQCFREAYQ